LEKENDRVKGKVPWKNLEVGTAYSKSARNGYNKKSKGNHPQSGSPDPIKSARELSRKTQIVQQK